MPKHLLFQVNGRVPLKDDDLPQLAAVSAALSDIVRHLKEIGMAGEFKTRIISTRSKRQEQDDIPFLVPPEIGLPMEAKDQHGNVWPLTPEQAEELIDEGETAITVDRKHRDAWGQPTCQQTNNTAWGPVSCYKPEGHEDWHEGEDDETIIHTWPADRPIAEAHPEPGGDPLPDRVGMLESMGMKGAFEYRQTKRHKSNG